MFNTRTQHTDTHTQACTHTHTHTHTQAHSHIIQVYVQCIVQGVNITDGYDGLYTCRLPPLTSPKPSHVGNVFTDAFVAVVVCYSVTLSLAKVFAKKHGYTIYPNQVCIHNIHSHSYITDTHAYEWLLYKRTLRLHITHVS